VYFACPAGGPAAAIQSFPLIVRGFTRRDGLTAVNVDART
jgi:hypothetical protein